MPLSGYKWMSANVESESAANDSNYSGVTAAKCSKQANR